MNFDGIVSSEQFDFVDDFVPSEPGIYFWYKSFDLNLETQESLLEFIDKIIGFQYSLPSDSRLGNYHRVSLFPEVKSITGSKRELLEILAKDKRFRTYFVNTFNKVSSILPPLYVGKADDLCRRLKEHIDRESKLSANLRKANLDINDCEFRYILMKKNEDFGTEDQDQEINLLFEEIFSKIFRPGFTARIG